MKTVQHLQLIEVIYKPATNTKPSYIKLHDLRFDIKINLSFDCEDNDIKDTAIKYLKAKGFNVLAKSHCDATSKDYIMVDNFEPINSATYSVNELKAKEMEK